MKLYLILLGVAHLCGDWLLQSREMARNKSTVPEILELHLLIVTFCLSLVVLPHWGSLGILLLIANFFAHGVIDWNIWSIYGRIRGDNTFETGGVVKRVNYDYWFFATVAIDQFLHLAVIIYLFAP